MLGLRSRHLARLVLVALVPGSARGSELDTGIDHEDASDRFFRMEGVPDDIREPWLEFVEGWSAFLDAHFMVQEAITLLLAAALAALIAYHPRSRPPVADAGSIERPKVVVIYGVVCAAIAEIVLFNPPMAFVIFGLGALLRFRSLIGSPKETGRTILAAVVALACGLKFFPVAILATAFGWILIWFLEARVSVAVAVRGLAEDEIDEAISAWRGALDRAGCRIVTERVRPKKGRLELLVSAPRSRDLRELEGSVDLPAALRDRAVWDWEP